MMLSKMSLKLSPAVYALSQLLLFMCSMMISSMVVTHHREERPEHSNNTIRCIEKERQALLHFKQGLSDTCGILTSWGSVHDEDQYLHRDCCQWRGIRCSNSTGHVISLNLRTTLSLSSCLTGNISSSLLVLEHLNYLDLSGINFLNYSIPKFIGSLVRLTYLNLSNSNISGEIPPQFKNLSNLQTLDLGNYNNLHAKSLAWASTLFSLKTLNLSSVELKDATDWVHVINSLPSLTYLNLAFCSLPSLSSLIWVNSSKSLSHIYLGGNFLSTTSVYPWLFDISNNLVELELSFNQLKGSIPKAIFNLNSLSYLDFSFNQLQGPMPEAIVNLSSLSYLALSNNQLQGPILEEIGNMKSLSHLDLSANQFKGGIPQSFRQLCNLRVLDLSRNNLTGDLFSLFKSWSRSCVERSLEDLSFSNNSLTGSLPDFSRFPSLILLDLSYNQLNGSFPFLANNYSSLKYLILGNNQISGSLPKDLGQLSQLETLDLSSNFFNGTITEAHLSNLPFLYAMELYFNKLSFNISPSWTPPFQLSLLLLDSCRLGPHFPTWLQTQHYLETLSFSNTGISDTLPGWFWEIWNRNWTFYVNLSHNGIRGALPDSGFQNFGFYFLDLSYNSLEGSIPSFLTQLEHLDLSNNKLSGSISSWSLTTNATLHFLDLTNNHLSGELPDCWMYINQVEVLNLGNNSFSGNIPSSFGNLNSLEVLDLSSNNFSGELPSSMKYCTSLQILDLSENFFSGQVPYWFGNNLIMLNVLILRQNEFFGSLPWEICRLHYIIVLDLSVNNFIGTIPNCLYNLTYLFEGVNSSKTDDESNSFQWIDTEVGSFGHPGSGSTVINIDIHAYLVWKGSRREYWKNLALVKSIDLSSNKLSGEIPVEISFLVGLQSLNLSRNHLTGPITSKLGQLKELESLDLSRNQLFGEIPISLSALNFLDTLDLSYNNLSGKIPSGTQLQSFDESSYMGNLDLCGPPLQKKCEEDAIQSSYHNEEEAKDRDNEFLSPGLYISIGLGFITGFWGACGILVFKRSCRYAYFRFCNHLYDKIFVVVVVCIVQPHSTLPSLIIATGAVDLFVKPELLVTRAEMVFRKV
ncbi:hypothetical protein Ancab_040376 [Ancistrocladus abbreviatus]